MEGKEIGIIVRNWERIKDESREFIPGNLSVLVEGVAKVILLL